VTGTFLAGLAGALWAVVLNLGVQVLLNQWALQVEARRAGVDVDYGSCFREWKGLWSFCLPATLSSMLSAPAMWVCQAFLVNQTAGYAQMGLFNAANQWRMAILFVPQKICMVALPVLSTLAVGRQIERFRETVRACAGLAAAASLAVAMPVVSLSWWIMRAYGQEFVSGTSTLCLLAVSAILMAVSFVGGQAIASLGRTWFRFFVHISWSLTLVGSAWVLVARGGDAQDLALAHVIAYGVHCAAQYALLVIAMRREGRQVVDRRNCQPVVPADRLAA
jgi:O-antigen/teichoic acid export membrane protein